MSHEKTIGVEFAGRHFVIPTVINGKEVTADQAVDAFKQGRVRPFGQFSTQVQADEFARERSKKGKRRQ